MIISCLITTYQYQLEKRPLVKAFCLFSNCFSLKMILRLYSYFEEIYSYEYQDSNPFVLCFEDLDIMWCHCLLTPQEFERVIIHLVLFVLISKSDEQSKTKLKSNAVLMMDQ